MINFKQQELIDQLFEAIKKKFPEVKLINVIESPEDPSDLWVNITAPNDEDEEIALRKFASEKSTDILMDYGYHILIMPTRNYDSTVASFKDQPVT